jgi:hypothetical protein
MGCANKKNAQIDVHHPMRQKQKKKSGKRTMFIRTSTLNFSSWFSSVSFFTSSRSFFCALDPVAPDVKSSLSVCFFQGKRDCAAGFEKGSG